MRLDLCSQGNEVAILVNLHPRSSCNLPLCCATSPPLLVRLHRVVRGTKCGREFPLLVNYAPWRRSCTEQSFIDSNYQVRRQKLAERRRLNLLATGTLRHNPRTKSVSRKIAENSGIIAVSFSSLIRSLFHRRNILCLYQKGC